MRFLARRGVTSMLDFNSRNAKVDRFVQLLDDAIDAKGKSENRRNYIGGSAIGQPCARRIQYEYLGTPKDEGGDFDARVRRIFRRGHECEEWLIGWIKDAGFNLRDKDRFGKQFGFEDCEGRFSGHFDGVIVEGPDGFEYPALFEAKCLGEKGFNQLVKHGVAKAYPVYAAQIATYQAYGQLAQNPAFFVAVNANDMRIHLELVPFNMALAQECADKAARVLSACDANEWLPRASDTVEGFACRFCPYKGECWQ